ALEVGRIHPLAQRRATTMKLLSTKKPNGLALIGIALAATAACSGGDEMTSIGEPVRSLSQKQVMDPVAFCNASGLNVIVGTPNNDVLTGTEDADCIVGLGSSDTIVGLGGDDVVFAGDGDDDVDGGAGDDELHGGSGQD